MSFGTLALIVGVGFAGPLLALGPRPLVPVVLGELGAGVVIGRTGFGWINADQPTLAFLAQIGFTMVMLMAGTHVPLHDQRLRPAFGRGVLAAVLVGVLAAPLGIFIADGLGFGHSPIWMILLATGSAAVVLPCLADVGLVTPAELPIVAQVTIADIATIVLIPLVLEPSRAGRAALGALIVSAATLALGLAGARAVRSPKAAQLRHRSIQRGWGLELRMSLLVVFVLAWIAEQARISVLIAGFGAGLLVNALGDPKRLIGQLVGVVNGLFAPLFFVVLGARLDLRAVAQEPKSVGLAFALGGGAIAVHLVAAVITRQPVAHGLIASAQLGVPAAVASIGLTKAVLTPAEASAVMLGAVITLAAAAAGALLLEREQPGQAGTPEKPAL